MEPSLDQMATKSDITFWKASRRIFNRFWIPTWLSRGIDRWFSICVFGFWGLRGAKIGPKSAKKPQETPETASRTDFGTMLVDSNMASQRSNLKPQCQTSCARILDQVYKTRAGGGDTPRGRRRHICFCGETCNLHMKRLHLP